MARREVGEINAGSMADIAFLLLIFFLVTTTMEVDAGIGRVLPLDIDCIDCPPPPPVIKRNVLEIMANSKDELLVEEKFIQIDELEEIVKEFYTANVNGERNLDMPNYSAVNISICQAEIAKFKSSIESNPDNTYLPGELAKWEGKLKLCNNLPTGSYNEISKSALIQLKNQSGTSYGLYIEIQNILKKVVNELRVAKCEEMGWPDYFELKQDEPEDQDIIAMLRILVPERIIEAKIDR